MKNFHKSESEIFELSLPHSSGFQPTSRKENMDLFLEIFSTNKFSSTSQLVMVPGQQ
jgi:hypothetical protein